MIKDEILDKIGFSELIGTSFEDLMVVREFKAGDNILDVIDVEIGAMYVYSGIIMTTLYSSEGKEIYRYFEGGSLVGVAESMEEGYINEYTKIYGVELTAAVDVTIVFVPFKDVFKYTEKDKTLFYKRIISLIRREKMENDLYSTGRLIYSDEEFILKAFEKKREFYMKRSDLARSLNITLRNLQRYVKYYIEIGILEKKGKHIYIKDEKKFQDYKNKVLDK